MNKAETNRFNELYQRHLRLLKLQGMAEKTIDGYSRGVRRITEYFNCCPDQLTLEQREEYFSALVEFYSWSTVKIDRNGLQFFWKHVLNRDWQWLNIVKPPKVHSLPDILTVSEVEQLIGTTRKLRYRVFLLTTYSMGLRLGETLSLQVGDMGITGSGLPCCRYLGSPGSSASPRSHAPRGNAPAGAPAPLNSHASTHTPATHPSPGSSTPAGKNPPLTGSRPRIFYDVFLPPPVKNPVPRKLSILRPLFQSEEHMLRRL